MANATSKAMHAYLTALWSLYHSQAQEEGESTIREIRMVEKVVENVDGLRLEKGWSNQPTS